MVTARRMARWDEVSALIAKIHNVNCTKESQTITPDQVHPLRRSRPSGETDRSDWSTFRKEWTA